MFPFVIRLIASTASSDSVPHLIDVYFFSSSLLYGSTFPPEEYNKHTFIIKSISCISVPSGRLAVTVYHNMHSKLGKGPETEIAPDGLDNGLVFIFENQDDTTNEGIPGFSRKLKAANLEQTLTGAHGSPSPHIYASSSLTFIVLRRTLNTGIFWRK
jgi:hypothetical protein